jgi:hypothetical protein
VFKRLKTWLVDWAERYQQREIERLHAECCRLKEELLEHNDGKPIRLSPADRRRLAEKAKGIDPEVLKQITVAEFEGFNPLSPNDTSTESP